MKIQLENCRVHAARANLLKNNVRLTFEVPLSDTVLEAKALLSILASEMMLVDLTILAQQFPLTIIGFEDVGDTPAEAEPSVTLDED